MSISNELAQDSLLEGELSPDLQRMRDNAQEATAFLKAVAHESRLMILCLLAEGERSVTEIEEALCLQQTTASQQLARLRLDGLISARREGKMMYYALSDECLPGFLSVIYKMFCEQQASGLR